MFHHHQIFLCQTAVNWIELPGIFVGNHCSSIFPRKKWRQTWWSELLEGTQLVNDRAGTKFQGCLIWCLDTPKPTFPRPLWSCHYNLSLGAVWSPHSQKYWAKPSSPWGWTAGQHPHQLGSETSTLYQLLPGSPIEGPCPRVPPHCGASGIPSGMIPQSLSGLPKCKLGGDSRMG